MAQYPKIESIGSIGPIIMASLEVQVPGISKNGRREETVLRGAADSALAFAGSFHRSPRSLCRNPAKLPGIRKFWR